MIFRSGRSGQDLQPSLVGRVGKGSALPSASMMIINNLFPPLPPAPPVNVHHVLFNTPNAQSLRKDYIVYADADTGFQLTRAEFIVRIHDLATAMTAPVDQGGLGMRVGEEMVAIFAPNSAVRCAD